MSSLPENFWSKVNKESSPSGCWVWTASKNKWGYGRFGVGRGCLLAHRLAFEDARGKLEDGQILLHSCDNPACVNPDHLRIGTHLENARDCIERGRRANVKLDRNPNVKLSKEAAEQIRKTYVRGRTRIVDVAKQFGVSKSQIWNIVSGCQWNEFPNAKPEVLSA